MNLVIVESPTKAKTISRFLKSNYLVRSSYGHVRDLPENYLGIDVNKNFKPKYIVLPKAKRIIAELKKLLSKSEKCILATDEDREGEAIAWHLTKALGLNEQNSNLERIVFHEITKEVIEEALKNPRKIDMNLVNAQQARRILDRLVGYKLSPFLWKKVAKGLSAGRVQSAALKMIVDREKEIENFVPQEYWLIEAKLKNGGEFTSLLKKIDNEDIPKPGLKTKEDVDKILNDLKESEFVVFEIERKEIKKIPPPPFITSTLQQEAFRKLNFSSKKTMLIAQELYEGIELGRNEATGLITYMRTDSTNIAKEALFKAKDAIVNLFSKNYYCGFFREYKTKSRLAQEAHEAIRPTDPKRTPESVKKYLTKEQFQIYDLIWRRFLATQMKEAEFELINAKIIARAKKTKKQYLFNSIGQTLKFDGFLKIYPVYFEEKELPQLKENEKLELLELIPSQHFTKPPPRFNEASLVKNLEKYGIGRPSTYASIISTIQERNYVFKNKSKNFQPTEIGKTVNELLSKHFPDIVDLNFTSKMEENLDEIAQGKQDWILVVKEFYDPFYSKLIEKYKEVKDKLVEPTKEICNKCGSTMVIRISRFGKFLACLRFPECKNTKPLTPPNSE